MRGLALAVLACSVTACTASLDVDRFHKNEAEAAAALEVTYFDFVFAARNMQSHLDEAFEIRLVDKRDAVQAKVVYVDIPLPDFRLELPKFVPKANGPYRIDFWSDHNHSGRYDGIEGGINDKDHAWRRVLADPLPEDVRLVGARYELAFLHDTAFVDIFTDLAGNPIPGADTLLPFALRVNGAGPWSGKMVEVRVVEKGSGRLVALHREGRARESYVATVTGVLDEETPYEISVVADADGDGALAGSDPSWTAPQAPSGEAR